MQNTEGAVSLTFGVNRGSVGSLVKPVQRLLWRDGKLLKQTVAAIEGYHRVEAEC
jgi:hypothetical protein